MVVPFTEIQEIGREEASIGAHSSMTRCVQVMEDKTELKEG